MDTFPYLVAIALIQDGGERAMPLGGKSLKKDLNNEFPESLAKLISLELMMRVFQRSEHKSIKRLAGVNSLLLIEISLDKMQEKLPILKSEWINSGDNQVFLSKLQLITSRIWALDFVRYEGLKFNEINDF